MNIIFLDIDGELTYSNYDNPETENIDIIVVESCFNFHFYFLIID